MLALSSADKFNTQRLRDQIRAWLLSPDIKDREVRDGPPLCLYREPCDGVSTVSEGCFSV